MFATLRVKISCVTIAPHENQNRKRMLLPFRANQGVTECEKNERLIKPIGNRVATLSSSR
jgi:hypothetical protein